MFVWSDVEVEAMGNKKAMLDEALYSVHSDLDMYFCSKVSKRQP